MNEPLKITQTEQLLIDNAKMCEALEHVEKDIRANTESINAGFARIDKTNTKQFAALIGVIMALIGQSVIGTPWYVDMAVIASLISGTFLVITLGIFWKSYSLAQRAVRITSSCLLLFSSFTQIWIYRPGDEPAPVWFTPLINVCLILLASALMWAGWTVKPKNGVH